MKAWIDKNGVLIVRASNETESYALDQWLVGCVRSSPNPSTLAIQTMTMGPDAENSSDSEGRE